MSKAEERARDLGYSKDPFNRAEYTANEVREAFIDGYHQAEKDMELTWEDMEKIVDLYDDIYCYFSIDGKGGKTNTKEHYQEVLKRFKNYKNGNNR